MERKLTSARFEFEKHQPSRSNLESLAWNLNWMSEYDFVRIDIFVYTHKTHKEKD